MPFVFDQPNLDDDREGHLHFDPGDGRLMTIFANEDPGPSMTAPPSTQAARITSRSECACYKFEPPVGCTMSTS